MKIIENKISWNDFLKIEMRVGTIMSAEVFKEVKSHLIKLLLTLVS